MLFTSLTGSSTPYFSAIQVADEGLVTSLISLGKEVRKGYKRPRQFYTQRVAMSMLDMHLEAYAELLRQASMPERLIILEDLFHAGQYFHGLHGESSWSDSFLLSWEPDHSIVPLGYRGVSFVIWNGLLLYEDLESLAIGLGEGDFPDNLYQAVVLGTIAAGVMTQSVAERADWPRLYPEFEDVPLA